MKNFIYETPTRVYFGRDEERKVGKLVSEFAPKKVLLHYGGKKQRSGRGIFYRAAHRRGAAHQKCTEQQPFFWVKGGGKVLRKCAIRIAGATMTSVEFYLKLPVRDLIEINNEVAEEWQKLRN